MYCTKNEGTKKEYERSFFMDLAFFLHFGIGNYLFYFTAQTLSVKASF